jgi:hypothetical protein
MIPEYDDLVRVKTDRPHKNRSPKPAQSDRNVRERSDIEIIERNATRLNREAMDTLEYQELP